MSIYRSYEIINESYFCVRHKNRREHNQHFKIAVFHIKIQTLPNRNKYLHNRKLNLLLTSSIYSVLFPLEMQKGLEQTKV